MANEKWIEEQVELHRLKGENELISKEKGLMIERWDAHIEVYEEKGELRKVVYTEKSLNFYLKGVSKVSFRKKMR